MTDKGWLLAIITFIVVYKCYTGLKDLKVKISLPIFQDCLIAHQQAMKQVDR
jgi:hypothetical protein